MKKRLVELGYLEKATHSLFGLDTYKAVKKFQSDNGLQSDGIVGLQTWNKLFETEEKKQETIIVTIPSNISAKKASLIAQDLQNCS